MPLEDGYRTEKELHDESLIMLQSLEEYLRVQGKNWGLVLFTVDYNTGTVNYCANTDHNDTIGMLKFWVNRNQQ